MCHTKTIDLSLVNNSCIRKIYLFKGEIFMERASSVMYSIGNFFTWLLAIVSIVGIVFCGLNLAHVNIPNVDISGLTVGNLVYFSIVLLVAIFTIGLARRAKKQGTSKGWDLLFLILGIIGANIFYFLGGLFGLIARRQ